MSSDRKMNERICWIYGRVDDFVLKLSLSIIYTCISRCHLGISSLLCLTCVSIGKVIHVGCIVCDEFLNSLTEIVAGRSINLQVLRQERHRRGGRGRGRGGRGRGRSGARKGDVKMSFSDF